MSYAPEIGSMGFDLDATDDRVHVYKTIKDIEKSVDAYGQLRLGQQWHPETEHYQVVKLEDQGKDIILSLYTQGTIQFAHFFLKI